MDKQQTTAALVIGCVVDVKSRLLVETGRGGQCVAANGCDSGHRCAHAGYRCGRYCARWTNVVDRRCARRRRRGISTTRATVVATGLASIRVVDAADVVSTVVLMCVAENVGRTGDDRCRRHRHGQIGHGRVRVVVVRRGEAVQRRDWLELCRLLLLLLLL